MTSSNDFIDSTFGDLATPIENGLRDIWGYLIQSLYITRLYRLIPSVS